MHARRTKRLVRFGVFELDLTSGDLWKDGRRLRLQNQPKQVLRMLVERAGELVTREELRHQLWLDDTFVDFENGLNVAVRKIREALGDLAPSPRFIGTERGHGYRFIAVVATIQETGEETRVSRVGGAPRYRALFLGATIFAVALTMVAVGTRPGSLVTRENAKLAYTQITNFTDSAVAPALSPDGRMVTFIRGDSTFLASGEIYVQLLPDGEPVQLTRDGLRKMSPVFSPDGSRIAYTGVSESRRWDTWTVPVLGGQPRLMLANASGLTWNTASEEHPRVLFSELTGEGIHMVLTIATEDRVHARRVYTPSSVLNGMAHRSSLSPDGQWVLVVEMAGAWLPCKLVPSDGSSAGRVVGPASAPCTYASWSPDGRWMYFSANAGDGFHIWRQKFPDGEPEQVTAGATDEEGVAFAADGRSFLTSIGVEQNTIWMHDSGGERQITSQGYAYLPKFSPDGKRLYYLLRSGVSSQIWVSGELWVTDLESGHRERLLSDFLMEDYSISPDGRLVVFSAIDDTGRLPVWVAALDGSSPPNRLANVESKRALFGPDGSVFFVQEEFLFRIRPDGSGRQKMTEDRVRVLYSVSADGKWVAVWTAGTAVVIYSLEGGPAIELCSVCGTTGAEDRGIMPPVVRWSRDGKFLYLHSGLARKTYVAPLQPGQILPPLPTSGVRSIEEVAALAHARPIPHLRAFVEDSPSVYVFPRTTSHRNIYRVAVP